MNSTGRLYLVVVVACFVALFLLLCLVIYALLHPRRRRKEDVALLQHVFITGGSSGIGLSIAETCITEYYPYLEQLTILARNPEQLKKAQAQLEDLIPKSAHNNSNPIIKPKIHILSCDVSDAAQVSKQITEYIQTRGTPTMLFNVAGTSSAGTMEDTEVSTYQNLMNINYFGSVYVTKAVLPHMKQQNKGSIVFTSSAAGQLGVFGYTAYSSTKFALRGLAEALGMEVRHYNLSVTVAYPPDTDTPGYQLENQPGKKPKETILIEQSGGVFQSADVARKMICAAVNGHDSVWFGLEGWMLNTLTAGMTPVTSLPDALAQVSLMSLLRFVSLFYLMDFDKITQRCKMEREKEVSKAK